MDIPNFPTIAWAVLAFVGFMAMLVPAIFKGLRVCVAEYYKFRRWHRRLRRHFQADEHARSS